MKEKLRDEYNRILKYSKENGLPDGMVKQSADYASGLWEMYEPLLRRIPMEFSEKVVVDFGCKYGHLLPLFLVMGATEAIGIDVVDEYLEAGRLVLEELYCSAKIISCKSGYIPLQPESVDIVFMNEVISHVNPGYLETVYLETSRILRKGGILYISDGNNFGNAECRKSLISLYNAWENGPDGTETDRDVVTKCFLTRRIEIITARHPDLGKSEVDYLAKNTSGLFGEFLETVIDEYVETGKLIERPYREGICPTNPSSTGEVMERGFYPVQVELALSNCGFHSYQVKNRPALKRSGLIGTLKGLYLWGGYVIKRIVKPNFERTESANFQIIGIKQS
jgi:SAM-dependent methyltransferase